MGSSTWLAGAAAARNGAAVTDCPYEHGNWGAVVWTNGWMTARHSMALEAKRDVTINPTATACSVCGKKQFDSPSGITCPDGHGGVEPLAREGVRPTGLSVVIGGQSVPMVVDPKFAPASHPDNPATEDDLFGDEPDDNSDLF